MPRKPKLRPSYAADGQYLLRLAHAVEKDTTRPAEWRTNMMEQLITLAHCFLLAPEGTNGQVKETQTQEDQEAQSGQGQDTAQEAEIAQEAQESGDS